MSISGFHVDKYQRPQKLSDPGNDFPSKYLDEILATPDNEIQMRHYRAIFQTPLSAGTYEECVYFLPGAFKRLLIEEGSNKIELIELIVCFVSEYGQNLSGDNLLEPVCQCIQECFASWTNQFVVVHFDRHTCWTQKGWRIDHFDFVENSEAVTSLASELVKHAQYAYIAEEFVLNLATNSDKPLKAAWFLEYARSWYDLDFPYFHKPIANLVDDEKVLQKAAETVKRMIIPYETSPTYWNDTFMKLGLE